jgi:VanZ family protein
VVVLLLVVVAVLSGLTEEPSQVGAVVWHVAHTAGHTLLVVMLLGLTEETSQVRSQVWHVAHTVGYTLLVVMLLEHTTQVGAIFLTLSLSL